MHLLDAYTTDRKLDIFKKFISKKDFLFICLFPQSSLYLSCKRIIAKNYVSVEKIYTRQRDFEVKSCAEENRLSRAIVALCESKFRDY